MRRKTKRAFRYLFPVILLATCGVLLKVKPSKNAVEKSSTQSEHVTGQPINTGAKSLSLISHNPQNATKLQINAIDAVQICEGEMELHNPSGVFESTKGPTALISKEATYHETERKIKFSQNVHLTHHSGLVATTDYAIVDTKTQDITGEHGIKVKHKESQISASAFELQDSGDLIKFNGNVCLNIARK